MRLKVKMHLGTISTHVWGRKAEEHHSTTLHDHGVNATSSETGGSRTYK